MGLLEGKTALVTGGSRGIGLSIVRRFLEEGASVAFTCRHLPEGLLEELGALGTVCAFESDAVDFTAAQEVAAKVQERFGRIDILMCNAGINRDTLLMRMGEDAWDEVIAAKSFRTVFCDKKNISSVAGIADGKNSDGKVLHSN